MVWLLRPAGQDIIFAEQVGAGELQLKVLPAGVELNVQLVDAPEQMVLVKGALAVGSGLIFTTREDVGPFPWQLVFVPYTRMLPEVALVAKFTLMKLSDNNVWVMAAPVPV